MNNTHISVVIVGKNRTLMTIECIKCIRRHLRHSNYDIIVGSDRSEPGHILAISSYLETINVDHTILECSSLGGMMNDCCNKAFERSDYVLCIENDMILHRDLDLTDYIDLLSHTNVGNIQFRYFSPRTHKCAIDIIEYRHNNYAITIPNDPSGCPVSFGLNFFSKRFYNAIGGFLDNVFETDKVERDFVEKYIRQFSSENRLFNALNVKDMHLLMNNDAGYFYHIGISSQHADVKWNKTIIPEYYHYLSDDQLDSKYRKLFI